MGRILILIALGLTLLILLAGILSMAIGGEFSKKYGNKLMQMRVAAQFIAVMLLFLFAVSDGE